MKRNFLLTLLFLVSFMAFSQTKILLRVADRSVTATLVDNEATRELKALLEKGDISINMDDYGGFEKVGALPQSFPTSNTQITTQPGDIMLYLGNNMVIFYESNSWSYTRLGHIDNATTESVREFLGSGEITLTISLDISTKVSELPSDLHHAERMTYDLQGRLVNQKDITKGIFVTNGHKTMIQ